MVFFFHHSNVSPRSKCLQQYESGSRFVCFECCRVNCSCRSLNHELVSDDENMRTSEHRSSRNVFVDSQLANTSDMIRECRQDGDGQLDPNEILGVWEPKKIGRKIMGLMNQWTEVNLGGMFYFVGFFSPPVIFSDQKILWWSKLWRGWSLIFDHGKRINTWPVLTSMHWKFRMSMYAE